MTRVLIAIALLPGLVLLIKTYKADKIEKEPLGLILLLFVLGGIITIPAGIAEVLLGDGVSCFLDADTVLFAFIENFFLVALVEEGFKYFILKKVTWNNKAFNYRFDAIVYAVTVSLGFATIENIAYVLSYGLETAIIRALISVPGHAIFAVYMGHYYGLAKAYGYDMALKKSYLRKALWISVFIHGLFDFSLSIDLSFIYFIIAIVILDIITLKKIDKLSKNDTIV